MELDRRRYLASIGTTLSALALAGCSEGGDGGGGSGGDTGGENVGDNADSDSSQYADAWAYDSDTEIVIENAPKTEIDSIGNLYIRGTATNVSGQDYDYVQLEFEVLDVSDAKVADGLANTSGLDDGQRWRFEALAPGADDGESYRISGITAY